MRAVKKKVKIYKATRIKEGKRAGVDEMVVEEAILHVFLNQQEVVNLSCTPHDTNHLAVGFLFSEGFLKTKEQIKNIDATENRVIVSTDPSDEVSELLQKKGVLTSGCGKGKNFADWEKINPMEDILIDLDFTLTSEDISEAIFQFEKRSGLFRQTAGVHSAALVQQKKIILFNEDIGRHNAVDKVLGESFLEGLDLKEKYLVISGRISSDVVSKLKNCGISVVVSRTAPTSLALDMALKLGITLVGFARGKRMNLYSFPVRIK
jgi:FdhD protein